MTAPSPGRRCAFSSPDRAFSIGCGAIPVARRAPTRFAPAARRPPRRVGRRTFGHGPGLSGPLTWGARLLFNRGLGLRQGRCATRDDASGRTRAPRRLDRNRRWGSRTGRSLARAPPASARDRPAHQVQRTSTSPPATNLISRSRRLPTGGISSRSWDFLIGTRMASIQHTPERPILENMDDLPFVTPVYKRDLRYHQIFRRLSQAPLHVVLHRAGLQVAMHLLPLATKRSAGIAIARVPSAMSSMK